MPKGRSWKKAELDATRARNKAMVASRHRHDPIAPLALAGAEDNLKYKGVVMINEDRLTVMETERDAARDAATARSAELDAEKHVAQFQMDELRRKLADAEAAKARLAREVEELRRKVAVAVTPVRAVAPFAASRQRSGSNPRPRRRVERATACATTTAAAPRQPPSRASPSRASSGF